jgi:hypothetical protein
MCSSCPSLLFFSPRAGPCIPHLHTPPHTSTYEPLPTHTLLSVHTLPFTYSHFHERHLSSRFDFVACPLSFPRGHACWRGPSPQQSRLAERCESLSVDKKTVSFYRSAFGLMGKVTRRSLKDLVPLMPRIMQVLRLWGPRGQARGDRDDKSAVLRAHAGSCCVWRGRGGGLPSASCSSLRGGLSFTHPHPPTPLLILSHSSIRCSGQIVLDAFIQRVPLGVRTRKRMTCAGSLRWTSKK